jgi:NAD(P)-dependent dehydrogenase (short-subunit alcohol dehydrogenase family)
MVAVMNHVVVTGGTGALGAAVIETLLARGMTVHVPMTEAQPPATLDGRVHAVPGVSLDREDQVVKLYAGLPALRASIHLVGGFAMAPVTETSAADFEKQWRLNTLTCFLCCREAVRSMKSGGRIVNVAARPAVTPTAGMIAYATAKAGVAALTQALAAEVLAQGILVNAVLPSIIDSPANRASMPKADHDSWPKPAQLAETIAFLASDANALTSGTLIPVYGRA